MAARPGRNANVERAIDAPPGQVPGHKAAIDRATSAVLKHARSGNSWAALRTLANALATKAAPLLDTPTDAASPSDGAKGQALESAGAALLSRWVSQRWRPQFGGLGLEQSAPLAALCERATPTAQQAAVEAASKVIEHLETLTSWHLAEVKPLYMEYEVRPPLHVTIPTVDSQWSSMMPCFSIKAR